MNIVFILRVATIDWQNTAENYGRQRDSPYTSNAVMMWNRRYSGLTSVPDDTNFEIMSNFDTTNWNQLILPLDANQKLCTDANYCFCASLVVLSL